MQRIALFFITLICLQLSSASNAATAIAFVPGQVPDTIAVAWNHPTQQAADLAALKACRGFAKGKGVGGTCKVGGRPVKLGAGALVCGKRECAWATGYDTRQEAADAAYRSCVNSDFGDCNGTGISNWIDQVGGKGALVPKAAPLKTCSPPAGKMVRSTSRCTNGDCTRTFENGCTVRFQAPYCHDPFSGKWEWKPDGC